MALIYLIEITQFSPKSVIFDFPTNLRLNSYKLLPPMPKPTRNLKATIICQLVEKDSMKIANISNTKDPIMHFRRPIQSPKEEKSHQLEGN